MKKLNKNNRIKYEPQTIRRHHMMKNKLWLIIACSLLIMVNMNQVIAQTKFEAVGPTKPEKRPSREEGTIKITFDLLPTIMSYDLPTQFCMVTENSIRYSNYAAETYDPRNFNGKGGWASFEQGMDKENRYVRVWIEHQSDARIVVRVRAALANNLYDISHTDIPSGSPYGKGDWVDEWVYIYPDGTNLRHMKIYTGLAPESRPFGFDRTPPKVVHEFMESAVRGLPGHLPTDDIEMDALTLIRLFGDHSEVRLPEGKSKTISYETYPKDFGDFRDANIMLVNLKSKYKPYTIAMPYGVRIQPYMPEGPIRYVFETWDWSPSSGRPYSLSLGHFLNYQDYRRDGNTLENVYLQGMTNAADPVKDLVSLAWSWIQAPRLQMEGLNPSYTDITYDPAQKAYIVPREGYGPAALKFSLEYDNDGGGFGVPMSIVNPAFIVKDWGTSGVKLTVDGKLIEPGKEFRIGYEDTPTGTDLILWLKILSSKQMQFTLTPISK